MVKPEVHFEIAMALAPVPSARDPDRREAAEARVTTAAKTVMTGIAPLKGPLEVTLSMAYAPSASMRRSHDWRVVAPSAWDLAKFILPLLEGTCFESGGQIAKLTVTKSYGARALTVITVRALAG